MSSATVYIQITYGIRIEIYQANKTITVHFVGCDITVKVKK